MEIAKYHDVPRRKKNQRHHMIVRDDLHIYTCVETGNLILILKSAIELVRAFVCHGA